MFKVKNKTTILPGLCILFMFMFIERVSEAKHFKKPLCKKLLRKLVI